MLPFTKRPGRGDESGESDVVVRDGDVGRPSGVASAALAASRATMVSVSDEEMTTRMAAKGTGSDGALGHARPSASPQRTGNFVAQEAEEDGRTVVRGAPKIAKRASSSPMSSSPMRMGMPTLPTTISPAAVIKATLESARVGAKPKNDRLMVGPPADLLEDLADLHPANAGSDRTAVLPSPSQPPPPAAEGNRMLATQTVQPQQFGSGPHAAGATRPMSLPSAPSSGPRSGGHSVTGSGAHAAQSGGFNSSGGYPVTGSGAYAASQSGAYSAKPPSDGLDLGPPFSGRVPSGSVRAVQGGLASAMPAHFMGAQLAHADARIDPPATAVSASTRPRARGRSAMSWAVALAAVGLGVGVAAMAAGARAPGRGGLLAAGASLVDPSRAGADKAALAVPAAAPSPSPVPVSVPPVAVPGAPAAVTAEPAASAPPPSGPIVIAPVIAPVAPAPPGKAASAPGGKVAAAQVVAPPARATASSSTPAARPVRSVSAEEPVVAAKVAKPSKLGAGAAAKGDSAVDEEQKKALKALQESQLETPF